VSLSNHFSVRAPAQKKGLQLPHVRLRDDSRHALPVVVVVALAGAVGVGFAVWSLASSSRGWDDVAGIAVLLIAAAVAEAFPVPIEGMAVGTMSLATIFIVAVAAIYGWDGAAIAGFLTMALVEVGRRRPFSRIAFNSGMYVLGGIAAGAAAANVDDGTLLGLVGGAMLAAVCFYLVDIGLLAAVVSRSRQISYIPALRNYVVLTSVPFAIMTSLSVILIVLWDRSPFVAVVLLGPLLATALYQRWIHGALDRLREFDRLKDEFIAVVSHELRTPLTSVYGASLTLRQHDLDTGQRNALLGIISTESARLARLLDDILWVSRLDSGRADTFLSSVEPLPVVLEVVDGARTHLPPTLKVDVHHSTRSPAVAADPDKLRQVLVNLVENAVKYSVAGNIEVRLEPYDRRMRFSISDEGPGIPVGERERVFDKFYRLDPDMTHGVSGTGLGLYICRELVERMHGEIWVESEAGEGATFVFELPLAPSS
jgi:signal transduction histidine kinase